MSLESISKQFEEYHAATADAVADLKDRLDAFETKANRPDIFVADGSRRETGKNSAESKAFVAYARRGVERMPAELQNVLKTSDDPSAGYLAPGEYKTELDRNLVQFSPVRSVARVGVTGSGEVLLPKRTAALTGYFVGETETRTASGPTYGLTSVPLGEIATYVDVSTRQLEDSAFDIGAELSHDFAEAFAAVESAAFINGDGTKGRPEGILKATGITTVQSGAATSVTADGLITMLFSLPAFYRARATWAMNSTTMAAIAKLKDGSGSYILQPGLQQGQATRLLGLGLIECPDLPDLAASSKSIVLGDWSRYRIFDKAEGTTVLRDPYSQATSGIVRMHGRRRVGATLTMSEAFRIMVTGT